MRGQGGASGAAPLSKLAAMLHVVRVEEGEGEGEGEGRGGERRGGEGTGSFGYGEAGYWGIDRGG